MFDTILWAVRIACTVAALIALVDVLRTPTAAFPAVDRQTKIAWAIFTGLSAVLLWWRGPMNFLGIIGVIATMFYFVDVRPKTREITGKS